MQIRMPKIQSLKCKKMCVEQSAFDLYNRALVCFPHNRVKGKLLIEDRPTDAIKKTLALITTEFDRR